VNCREVGPEVDRGAHDPRLWSNLRGMLDGEGSVARVEAHRGLECRDGQTVVDAASEGWSRHGTEGMLPIPAVGFIVVAIVAGVVATRKRADS